MKQLKLILVFIFIFFNIPIAMALSPEGEWTTIDDETGQKRSVVRLSISSGELSGTILKVYPRKGDTGICSKCSADFKDKPIQGLRFLWGLKDDGDGEWRGGSILDPKTGKIYHVKLSVHDNTLHVRGYVGVPMLGRTQVWVK